VSEGFRPGSVAEKKEKQAQAWIGWELERTLVIVGALAHEASLLLLWVSSLWLEFCELHGSLDGEAM
jgi:hypothetical protein